MPVEGFITTEDGTGHCEEDAKVLIEDPLMEITPPLYPQAA